MKSPRPDIMAQIEKDWTPQAISRLLDDCDLSDRVGSWPLAETQELRDLRDDNTRLALKCRTVPTLEAWLFVCGLGFAGFAIATLALLWSGR